MRKHERGRILDAWPSDLHNSRRPGRMRPSWVADEVPEEADIVDETEGSHEDEGAKFAEFQKFLEEVDPEDVQG